VEYQVTFDDGSIVDTQYVHAGDHVDHLPATPQKQGYIFDGWYTEPNGGGTRFTETTPVTRDITVYAKWTPQGGGAESLGQSYSVTGKQLYTTTEDGMYEYHGTGIPQTVTGFMLNVGPDEDEESPAPIAIGPIGSISADGKLTLNLGQVSDDKLFDFSVPGTNGVKVGLLGTLPELWLSASNESGAMLAYLNKDINSAGVSAKQGWVLFGEDSAVSISKYNWVIGEQGSIE
jgi:uncharacterized repeat protein (TIGR02543 family)